MSHRPDAHALLASAGWSVAGGITPVTGGWDNHLWKFSTADGRVHALRLYRDRENAKAAADNEALAMETARAAGLPTAANEARGTFDGAPYFIQEWVAGVPMLDAMKSRPWRMWGLAREFGRLQARIHRIPPPPGLRRVDAEHIRDAFDDERLTDALRAAARIDTFCHLDYHPLNVLVSRGTVTAVLDWTNAGVTDRRADLAFSEVALLYAPLPPGPVGKVLGQLRKAVHRGWRAGYTAEARGFPLTPLFRAAALAGFTKDVEDAVREGRGWATTSDVAALQRHRDRLKRAAGL